MSTRSRRKHKEEFGQYLKALREAANLTLERAGELLSTDEQEITRQALWHYEQGKVAAPRLYLMVRMAEIYNADLGEILEKLKPADPAKYKESRYILDRSKP